METVPGQNQSMHDASKYMSRFDTLEASSNERSELLFASSVVVVVVVVIIWVDVAI